MDITLHSRRVLTAAGQLAEMALCKRDGIIAQMGEGVGTTRHWDVGDCLVLPGMVDLHGDAFVRRLMPRPGVNFPITTALLETDRQLIANGRT